ncbi:ATP-grasp domain-containing protein [Pseudomonas sp. UBA6562]|uniref:ATP-grasp domain-containing protein n=1 Tax=Pseudomonas sp. UBA6562 TaxID=1947332 RepID=UPI0025FF70D3|nr:ATP-grasp domain-containing protein [Pseudomonas sp. UBA6562]
MRHIVFVDSTVSGLLALEAAKKLDCRVTFIHQRDASFLNISLGDDTTLLASYLHHVDNYVRVDSLQDEAFSQCLSTLHLQWPIDALVTTSEAAILPVAREAQRLGLPCPDYDALCNAVFKNCLRETLKTHGLRSPNFEVLTEQQLIEGDAPQVALPFVVKPIRGFAKQFSAICHHRSDFDVFLNCLRQTRSMSDPMINRLVSRDYLIEQYIDGSLYSAEVIVQEGKVSCYATTIRFRADYNEILEMTSTMPSGLDETQRNLIKLYVQAVFDALKINFGLYHVELLLNESGPCLVEINARMMGSVSPQMYRLLTGIDPFELMIRLHLGEEIKIDDSALKSAGSVVTIASRFGGFISAHYDPNEFSALLRKYDIQFCTARVFPGQAVQRYSGNIGTIGHVIIEDTCPYAAAAAGNCFLQELSLLYGLELATYTGPELHRQ